MTDNVYRVDRFRVPASVREEFLVEVLKTHELLRKQPGFRYDLLLEQDPTPDEVGIVTVAAWDDQAAAAAAGAAVVEMRRTTSFDPGAFMARLGVTADLGNYRELV
jgi:quinol monooxygenase YgiN